MKPRRLRLVVLISALAAQALLVVAIALSASAGRPPSIIMIGLAGCFVPYAVVLAYAPGTLDCIHAERLAVLALAVFGTVFVLAPPSLSDDVYRFVWEGRLWSHGLNPYRVPPLDASLVPLRDAVWNGVNNKSLATIYPPFSQALFALVVALGGGVTAMKSLVLAAHLATTVVVGRISGDPRAPFAIALNPLLLGASALDGHLDILVGLTLLVAAYALTRRRFFRAAVATCTAVGLKVIGLVLAPLFIRRPRALLAISIGSAIILMPLILWAPPIDAASGAAQFATRWAGNESGYLALDWLSRQLFEPETAALVARASAMSVVVVVGLGLAWRRVPALHGARVVLWVTLLLSPQVHPWYLAWLLPIEVVSGRFAGLVWSATALCAYAPLDRWMAEGVWYLPAGLQLFEYALVALALVAEHRIKSRAASTLRGV